MFEQLESKLQQDFELKCSQMKKDHFDKVLMIVEEKE